MEVHRPATSPAAATSSGLPLRKRLANVRNQFRRAIDDDREDQRWLLDDIDLSWLAELPHPLPRGSVVNVLI